MAAPEAYARQDNDATKDYTATAAYEGGDVVQDSDGRAGVIPTDLASGAKGSIQLEGIFKVPKTNNVCVIDGMPLFWDHSANEATYAPANDRDFYLGVAVGDATNTATTCNVALNRRGVYAVDLQRDGFNTAFVGNAGLEYRGFPLATFNTVAEAQKVDALSYLGFAPSSKWIVEGCLNIRVDPDNAAVDLNVGVANETHASNADTITESLFLHIDGNSANVLLESDDGVTEVAATDTSTVDWANGTPLHFIMDARDQSDVQVYINGVHMLPSSAFRMNGMTNTLKLMAHFEKSSDDSPGEFEVRYLRARIAQQASQ